MIDPIVARLERAAKGPRLVLSGGGSVLGCKDAPAGGRCSEVAADLVEFIEDHNAGGLAVEIAAEWPVYLVGAYTLRQRLARALRAYPGGD